MVFMYARSFSSPSASIFCGLSATAKSARVALFTPASVAWAERTTATSSVYGLRCSSSPLGSGFAFLNRLKASRTSADVQRRIGFAGLFGPREGFDPTTAFVAGLSTTRTPVGGPPAFPARLETVDDLSRGLRVILAMPRGILRPYDAKQCF